MEPCFIPLSKYFALHYSREQHDICLKHDSGFRPNLYKGIQYTELKTGQTLYECRSDFDDAETVFSGTIDLYNEAEKSDIIFR